MIKSLARTILKSIPENLSLYKLLKNFPLGDKTTHYLNFKGEFSVLLENKPIKFISTGSTIDNRLFWRGIDEREGYSMKIWNYLTKRSTNIMDVGANIGVFALIAKTNNPKANVHAFEPIPYTFSILKSNIDVNKYEIIAHQIALGNENGENHIFMTENNFQTPSMNGADHGSKIDIQIRTLDSIAEEFNFHQVDLLKIDVETFEPQVIAGMKKILEQNKPTFLIEILNDEVGAKVQELLKNFEYQYYYIDEEKGLILSNDIKRLSKSRNYLICQKEIGVLILENIK